MKKTILLATLILALVCQYAFPQGKLPNLIGTTWQTEPLVLPKTNYTIKHVYFFIDRKSVERKTFVDDQSPGIYFNPFTKQMEIVPTFHDFKKELGTYKISGNTIYFEFSDETLEAKIENGMMLQEIKRGRTGLKSYKATKVLSNNSVSQTGSASSNKQSKIKSAKEFSDEALILAQKGEAIEAIENFTKAINLDSDDAFSYQTRGEIRSKFLKQYGEAVEDYNQVIRIYLDWKAGKKKAKSGSGYNDWEFTFNFLCPIQSTYHERGVVKKMLGDELGASEDFRKACRLGFDKDC